MIMLDAVEAGALWPKNTQVAKSGFLFKDDEKQENPLAYRALTVLPVVSRKWASRGFRDLDGWNQLWHVGGIFILDGGAEEAWWSSALEF